MERNGKGDTGLPDPGLGGRQIFCMSFEMCYGSTVAFTLEIWYVVVKKYKLKGGVHTFRWFANDLKFKPGVNDRIFKEWAQNSIMAICTVSENGEFMSFQDLKESMASHTSRGGLGSSLLSTKL